MRSRLQNAALAAPSGFESARISSQWPDMLEIRNAALFLGILTCGVLLGIATPGAPASAQSNDDAMAQMNPDAPPQQGAQGNPICIRLEGQLATIDRGAGTGDPAKDEQIRRYQEAQGKQQAELDRVTLQAKRMGCESSGFFSLFNGRSAQCGPVNNQIQQMRANLEGLLGRTLPARGRPDQAIADLRKDVEDLRLTLPNSGPLALRELQLANALVDVGDIAGAQDMAAMAQAHWLAFSDGQATPRVDTTFAITRARVVLAEGDAKGALALLDPERAAIRIDRLRLLIERSRALLALGRNGEALAAAELVLQDLASLPEGTRPVHLEASALQRLGEAQRAMGNQKDAVASLSRALTIRSDQDAPGSIWRIQLEKALAADAAMMKGALKPPAGVAAR
jgi:tetratricopeptide (TPR) repeat protein